MTKRTLCFDWSNLNGARKKKRKLYFDPDEDGRFVCPVSSCLHASYKTKRGLRKHVNTLHEWFMFFDTRPEVKREEAHARQPETKKASTHHQPSFSVDSGCGLDFVRWLETPCGGGKNSKDSKQIAKRGMKYLMYCVGDCEDGVCAPESYIDCCIGNPTMLMKFLKLIMEDWKLKSAGAISYLKAISDLCDFRKWHGVPDSTLRLFTVTEVYLRRSKSTLYRKRNVEYSRDLSLESLIAQKSWASLQEIGKVIPHHSPKYQEIFKSAGANEGKDVTISDLAFATRFIITFLLLRVKCTRPMSLQFMTTEMLESATKNGGFVDQTKFKTSTQFQFDTLKFSDDALEIVNGYRQRIRPLCKPKCEYVIVTTNGTQYTAFCNAMSILTHEAIGKHITPTRLRAIVESESVERLDKDQQSIISQDQKHSSYVARRCYQKKLSRDVAVEGAKAMQELVGENREIHTGELASSLREPDAILASLENASTDADEEVHVINDDRANEDEPSSSKSNFIVIDSGTTVAPAEQFEKEDVASKIIVSDDIEVKKEELQDGKRFLQFTKQEDDYLRDGYKKHNKSRTKWSDIIKDKSFEFQEGRTRDSLRMRANTLGLEKKTKAAKKKKP